MSDRILQLPDEALYHLLVTVSLKRAAEFERVYYKQRKLIFDQAKLETAKEFNLPLTLTFKQMSAIESAKDKNIALIKIGDYPNYIDINNITKDTAWEAIANKRENTALMLLQRTKLKKYYFIEAVYNRLTKVVAYLFTQMDVMDISMDYPLSQGDLLWLLENFNFSVSAIFIEYCLKSDIVDPTILAMLLKQATLNERKEAYEEHLDDLENDLYLFDLSEQEKEKLTQVFRQYL